MNNLETTALQRAQQAVAAENPNLPLPLRFEVTPPDIIQRLLLVTDLTMSTAPGTDRNIIGRVYDQVLYQLEQSNFENITIVRGDAVVSAEDNFDKLLFSPGNPGRSSTYTRYTDPDHILRTHTTALIPDTFKNLDTTNLDKQTFILPGLVYRRDVIDPRHLDVFHQIDVWTLQSVEKHDKTTRADLLKLAQAVFQAACPDAEMIVLEAVHPYTVDGIEVYAQVGDKQIEVFEAGLIHPQVLRNAGVDPERFSGLALGMGVERLIMARKNLPDIRLIRSTDPRIIKQMTNMEPFKSVSDQPAMSRDISYCVDKNYSEEDICEKIRDAFGEHADLLEEVTIIGRTHYNDMPEIARVKLGAHPDQDNVLVRIILRHPDKTLTKSEANVLYTDAYPKLHEGSTVGYA
jgi:phenylalanyl-tRNA synthetase alpha chain